MSIKVYPNKTPIAISIVWLFHLSAVIGIASGFQSWFVAKTPLNLLVCTLLFALVFPLNTIKKALVFATFFITGMVVEWCGVHYGLPFGSYAYGNNFGPKIDGVPFLIGTNWAVLAFITASISKRLGKSPLLRTTLGAFLMVFLDFLMEHTAPVFDFWEFIGGMPDWRNYVSWLVLALIFQYVVQHFSLQGNPRFSMHLYLAQCCFFGFLFFFL